MRVRTLKKERKRKYRKRQKLKDKKTREQKNYCVTVVSIIVIFMKPSFHRNWLIPDNLYLKWVTQC
jgi:hypothetical protein